MIKKLSIRNFQSHEKSILNFHPGVNVIVGDTDSGKSAIIRALRWVVYGKPRGDSFCSWWEGETKVTITTEEYKIYRIKNKSENIYGLGFEEPTIFRAFGNDVPQEIVEALNMDEINLQRQGDAPFLISNTPGEVARHFNRMANLEQIDLTISNVQSEIKKTTQLISAKEIQLTELKKSYQEYEYLGTLENSIKELEDYDSELQDIIQKEINLTVLIESLQKTDEEINSISSILLAENDLNNIETLLNDLDLIEAKESVLLTFIESINKTENRIKKGERFISIEGRVNEINILFEERKTIETTRKKLNIATLEIKTTNTKILDNQKIVETNENLWSKNAPMECPLCGNPMNKNYTHIL